MSYQNPLIIQNKPYESLGQAANQAAASIQDAILTRMADQERKAKEEAAAKREADALAVEQVKISGEEANLAKKNLEAVAYANTAEKFFTKSSTDKSIDMQRAANMDLDVQERIAAQKRVNGENTFQQNQVTVNALLGEDKEIYDKMKADGKTMFFNGPMGKAYSAFLDGNANFKMVGKRVGNEWIQSIVDTSSGASYELPVDKIKDGTWDAYIDTPDLYAGMRDQAKEYNTGLRQRANAPGEWRDQDFDQANVLIGNDVMKAQADFGSYLSTNQLSAEAFLENKLRISPEKLKPFGGTNKGLMEALTSGDGGPDGKYTQAIALVNAEIAEDVEGTWLETNGVYREDDGQGGFKVKKFEAAPKPSSSGSKEKEKEKADRQFREMISSEIVNNILVDDKESFVEAFQHSLPYPGAIGKVPVIETIMTDNGFKIILDAKSATGGEAEGETADANTINFENFKNQGPSEVKKNYKFDFGNSGHMKTYLEISGYGKGMSANAILAQAKALAQKYRNSTKK